MVAAVDPSTTMAVRATPHLSPSLPQLGNTAGGVLNILHDPAHPSEGVLPVAA